MNSYEYSAGRKFYRWICFRLQTSSFYNIARSHCVLPVDRVWHVVVVHNGTKSNSSSSHTGERNNNTHWLGKRIMKWQQQNKWANRDDTVRGLYGASQCGGGTSGSERHDHQTFHQLQLSRWIERFPSSSLFVLPVIVSASVSQSHLPLMKCESNRFIYLLIPLATGEQKCVAKRSAIYWFCLQGINNSKSELRVQLWECQFIVSSPAEED